MGRCIVRAFNSLGIDTVVIDPGLSESLTSPATIIRGRATMSALKRAGIEQAAGILAGTDSDAENLGIILNARAVNPGIFVVVRQNRYRNQILFNAADADLIMQPNLVSARRIHWLLTAPLLPAFLRHVREHQFRGDRQELQEIIGLLHDRLGDATPKLRTVVVNERQATAATRFIASGRSLTLSGIMRDPTCRLDALPCAALVLRSGREVIAMPPADRPLCVGDEILICGSTRGFSLLDATLNNEYTLYYVITGVDPPRGHIMRWLMRHIAPGKEVFVPR